MVFFSGKPYEHTSIMGDETLILEATELGEERYMRR